jgi:GH15 family glucan-1,4-alpha-glucosidase
MGWVALDRLIEMQERGHMSGLPAPRLKDNRERIRAQIESRGWNPKLQSYTQILDGDTLDASLLLIALHGLEAASSGRMRQTQRRVEERLSAGPGLLYRNEDSLPAGEGAFAMCGFWMAELLARGGASLKDARRMFEQALAYANDVDLFAEEIDPRSGDALGNFPQAFTHVGLINAALALAEREDGEHLRCARHGQAESSLPENDERLQAEAQP